jgi:hypothetical protein
MRQDDEPTLMNMMAELTRIQSRLLILERELDAAIDKQVEAHTAYAEAFEAVYDIKMQMKNLNKTRQNIESSMTDSLTEFSVTKDWSQEGKQKFTNFYGKRFID